MNEDDRKFGCVAAGTPEAAKTGVDILQEGGNAIDAAVAISLVLGVTEPSGSGIGGQGTFIVYKPGDDPFVINGTSYSPTHTPKDATLADLVGHRASTVPSLLKVLEFAWQKYGSGRIGWQRLVEPSIRYATEGFQLGAFRHKALMRYAGAIRLRSGTVTKTLLTPKGEVPKEGAIVKYPILGKTLEQIAKRGANEFYSGEIAREMVSDMAAHDGWITFDDLKKVKEPPVLKALKGTYRGFDVYTLPPPASGWVVLLALNILEQAPEGMLATEGVDRLVRMAEALTAAHRHRVSRPVADLREYEDSVNVKINKEMARRIVRNSIKHGSGETTHFSVVDKSGTMVGVTQSLNSYYGAKVASAKLGFLYNDYMREFIVGATVNPYALRADAMPYSSMSASILAQNGMPCLVLGSPGDERIISAVVQVISHWVDVGKGIKAAVAAPRMHTLRGEEVLLEICPQSKRSLLKLERKGFTVHQPLTSLFANGNLNPYFGGVHAVAVEEGKQCGTADPRRDGVVLFAAKNRNIQ